jgi:hypothetical protein
MIVLDTPSLFNSDPRFNSSRSETEIEGAFLAKTRLPLAKRVKLAAALRDGRVTLAQPTAAQCAALCRVPAASLRARTPRKPSPDALDKAWARATVDGRSRLVRARLAEVWSFVDAITR